MSSHGPAMLLRKKAKLRPGTSDIDLAKMAHWRIGLSKSASFLPVFRYEIAGTLGRGRLFRARERCAPCRWGHRPFVRGAQ